MNMVVICCDTFRADIIGKGKKLSHVQTPHLDKLASESLVFDRAYAEGLPTIPFRRCVYTGVPSFPWRFDTPNEGLQPAGNGWHPIPPDQDTLAETLHDAGFVTGLVADTYHMFKATQNFTRGFMSWRFIRGQEMDGYRSGPMSRIDLAATILNLLGVDHEQMAGADAWASATGKIEPARDHITTGWATKFNVRDAEYSVHLDVSKTDPELVVYNLGADPDEKSPLSDPPQEVCAQALERTRAAIGDFPDVFNSYEQRHLARALRSFVTKGHSLGE